MTDLSSDVVVVRRMLHVACAAERVLWEEHNNLCCFFGLQSFVMHLSKLMDFTENNILLDFDFGVRTPKIITSRTYMELRVFCPWESAFGKDLFSRVMRFVLDRSSSRGSLFTEK